MGESPLSLVNTDSFRKKLVLRNLPPYPKSPSVVSYPINTEYIQSDYPVIDSPDYLIDSFALSYQLYLKNQWGPANSYNRVADPNILYGTKTNQGEYGPGQEDAKILDQALPASKQWKPLNAYGDGKDTITDAGEDVISLELINDGVNRNFNDPYYSFVASYYSPYSILLFDNPRGSDGTLSEDSFIAQLGAKTLRKEFNERIATELIRQTIGQANFLNTNSASNIIGILTGRIPLLEPNYTITVPRNPIVGSATFALKLAGTIIPTSPIPGSYWDTSVSLKNPTKLEQIKTAFGNTGVGNFFNRLLGADKTGSEIFYENTGDGQKSVLFSNIDYNKYKPSFNRTLFNRLSGANVESTTNNSDFYVGSINSDPSRIFSPSGEIPVDSFGREIESSVYGPQELSKIYEGVDKTIRLGANGKSYSDGAGIEGGLVWVSPKYKNNAGKFVGKNGEVYGADEDFNSLSFTSSESTNIEFTSGSILDDTQRLVNSQPNGAKRYQHAGNAIDQVSKVFNDGYKEITKGSKVLKYVGAIGQEVGAEYCRLFTKDTPYLQYRDLQKTDGITTSGRKFSYSVLDNTYNLNIAPNKQEGGQDSTNIVGSGNNAFAKKYMFSLENLAWRTSNTPGFTVSDLPVCERGPNGGRVMWFPPYDLKFDDKSNPKWTSHDFLGRPEPIYTYTNTSRGGSLSWSMVVDHPSSLNLIVNKVLSSETNREKINSMLESFFAGCLKYDLYELAKKYYTINPNDLFEIQKAITSKQLTRENLEYIVKTIQTGNDSTNNQNQTIAQSDNALITNWSDYSQVSFYFDNDYPKNVNSNFDSLYQDYVQTINSVYSTKANGGITKKFYDDTISKNYDKLNELAVKLGEQLDQFSQGNITLIIDASCSAPATKQYNKDLASRRINSASEFFANHPKTKKYVSTQRLIVLPGKPFGEESTATVKTYTNTNTPTTNVVNCTDNDVLSVGGDTKVGSKEIFTPNAMACRRAYIKQITSTLKQPQPQIPEVRTTTEQVLVGNLVTENYVEEQITDQTVLKDNITKRVLRSLLSECDYFEAIKQETPLVYDNLRDKLKYFSPTFHSMTPEGLNSRLTFLHQCTRPGDTIPTVRSVNGVTELDYNNAVNTAFGAPPVLVLRIGDFYHSKIIPQTLTIAYENLDLNPEGIGVQPMIAKVTLSFDFVGGHGLKEAVDRVQNALSFNFFANTEIWDDRAISTDMQIGGKDISVFDAEFLESIGATISPPTLNQTQNLNGQNNNSTIGNIVTINTTSSGSTGTINYNDFMARLVKESQNYFSTTVNKNREILLQYNNAMRQQWLAERNYYLGEMYVSGELNIVGKPKNLENRILSIFTDYIKDIENNDDLFIKSFLDKKNNISSRTLKILKTNYINYINDKYTTYINAASTIIQDLVSVQQNYINLLGRANIITFSGSTNTGTDGFQDLKGNVTIYVITGTTSVSPGSPYNNTLTELEYDIKKITDDVGVFNSKISSVQNFTYDSVEYSSILVPELQEAGGIPKTYDLNAINSDIVFYPFTSFEFFNEKSFRRQYMIMSNDILDSKKYDEFRDRVIGNIIGNKDALGSSTGDVGKIFDDYWSSKKPIFDKENKVSLEFISTISRDSLTNYLNYTPFPKKDRVFTFSTFNPASINDLSTQNRLIKSLGSSSNEFNTLDRWNDMITSSAYISKSKLN